ncbi:anti-sigma factor domain-containing protein [Bacillus sp. Marseille-Q3570]|uniref:anti-sigma factor domain-containing protein n=1 Tax=Bacillus sp. Marseille-Q3570 TaxID=2963522 RepID=UPI0021B7CDDB|nr:anti-sigma factor domain-containing protein [Bacillus sp. Marseille-Q3570]
MKRGLIMEVSKRKAVILTKDGSFERVRLKKGEQPEVGQEYICPPEISDAFFQPRKTLLPSFSLSLVAIIVFVLVAGGMPFGTNKASAAAYVSFDINPSIEVAVDNEMNVIKVRALNEDAKNLLEGSEEYKDSSLLVFSDSLFKTLKESGYFDTYEDLLITSTIDDDFVSDEMRKRLNKSIERLKASKYIENTGIVLSLRETTEATRKLAEENGLSMGKYLVFEDISNIDDTFTLDQASVLSLSEMNKYLTNAQISPEDSGEQQTEEPLKIPKRNNSLEHIKHTKDENDIKDTSDPEVPDTNGTGTAASGDVKDDVKDTAKTAVENPDEKEEEKAAASEPVSEPVEKAKNATTAPAKDQTDKEDKARSESDQDKTSKKNEEKNDLQVKIKLDLHGLDADELTPQELKLLENLQINIFHAQNNGKSKMKKHSHPHQDKQGKGSHGKNP